MKSPEELKKDILDLVEQYVEVVHAPKPFEPGKTLVQYAGTTFDRDEHSNLLDVMLSHWYAYSKFEDKFCKEFSALMGGRPTILTNSGSSANLLALSVLTSRSLENRLKPGDEVITVAAGFPTTVNPILQNGAIPVFLDVKLGTYNIDVELLDEAVGPRTKAIMIAHTLGNPFDLGRVMQVANRHNLWLIEDTCDALGSTYECKQVGTFGDLSTFSFYPAHHITMGEGGAISASTGRLKKSITSFRDWGRDCWCDPGKDNTCGKRFNWDFPKLPPNYDHKYVYSEIGYNLKGTDFSPALGLAQLKKFPSFAAARRANAAAYTEHLRKYEEFLLLPQATARSDPCWFAYPIYVRPDAPFTRAHIQQFLEARKIQTRTLFSGNLLLHPAYNDIPHRIIGTLENTNRVMSGVFFVGTYQGIDKPRRDWILQSFDDFFKQKGLKP